MMQNPFAFVKAPALDPSQAADQYSLGQKQALINALKQAAMSPAQPQQYGAIASRTSPITPIVQALMGYKAGKDQDKLNTQVGDLAKQQQAQTLSMMGGGQPQQQTAPQQLPDPYSPQMQDAMQSAQMDQNAQQLVRALSAQPQQQVQPSQQPMRDKKWVTNMNPGGFEPGFASMQYRTLGPDKYSAQFVEPFIKPHNLQGTSHGMRFDPQNGQYSDAEGRALSDAEVQARMRPEADKPMDELSKLNADFKAGRIEKKDYEARKLLMTTRASGGQTFGTPEGDLLASLAVQGVSLPAGLRSKEQQHSLLAGLLRKYPELSTDELATKIHSGQISFGAEKKETTTAAALAGRTSVGENELIDFIPKALAANEKVPRGSFMPFNKLVQLGERNISDPDLKELYGRTQAILNAYDIVAARGGTDMEKRQHNRAMLETADSPETYARAAAVIADEAKIAKGAARKSTLSFDEQKKLEQAPAAVHWNDLK